MASETNPGVKEALEVSGTVSGQTIRLCFPSRRRKFPLNKLTIVLPRGTHSSYCFDVVHKVNANV